jgi:hypothetical protein
VHCAGVCCSGPTSIGSATNRAPRPSLNASSSCAARGAGSWRSGGGSSLKLVRMVRGGCHVNDKGSLVHIAWGDCHMIVSSCLVRMVRDDRPVNVLSCLVHMVRGDCHVIVSSCLVHMMWGGCHVSDSSFLVPAAALRPCPLPHLFWYIAVMVYSTHSSRAGMSGYLKPSAAAHTNWLASMWTRMSDDSRLPTLAPPLPICLPRLELQAPLSCGKLRRLVKWVAPGQPRPARVATPHRARAAMPHRACRSTRHPHLRTKRGQLEATR